MTTAFDYSGYGAFKQSEARSAGFAARLARRLGFGNRYVAFVRGLDPAAPVVEIGCGDGAFMREMRSAGFADVSGVDLSPSYFEAPGRHTGDAEPFLEALQDGSLGGVVALDVFEHIPVDRLETLCRLIARKLKPGGQLVFRVPNLASPLALYNQHGDLSHVTAFTEVSAGQLAFDAGMTVVAIHPEPLCYPRSLSSLVGFLVWPIYREMTRLALAAFGIRARVLTPAIVCVFTRG